jgi:hypothetical protein
MMNWKAIWKVDVVAHFIVLFQHLSGKTTKSFGISSGPDYNPEYPKYEERVVTATPRRTAETRL